MPSPPAPQSPLLPRLAYEFMLTREGGTMEVTINGQTEAGDYGTVAQLLTERGLDPKLVVVEVNGQILPAADFASRRLTEGDVVEIVQFVAGG